MNKLKTLSILTAILLLAGCVLSDDPFYTDEYVVEMPELNGQWQQLGEDGNPIDEKPLEFDGNKIHVWDSGVPGTLHVTYFRIGDSLFADTKIENMNSINAYLSLHLIDGHMVSRIILEGDRLKVRTLDIFWFVKYIKEHPFGNNIQTNDYTIFVANASPQDWINLLKQFGTDKEAFPDKGALVYLRKN